MDENKSWPCALWFLLYKQEAQIELQAPLVWNVVVALALWRELGLEHLVATFLVDLIGETVTLQRSLSQPREVWLGDSEKLLTKFLKGF